MATALYCAQVAAQEAAPAWKQELDALRALVESQQATIGQLQSEVTTLRDELSRDAAAGSPVTISPPAGDSTSSIAVADPAKVPLPSPKPSPEFSFTHEEWAFEVYGYVKIDAAYDTNHTHNGDFARYVLPGSRDNQLSITARQTRLGLAVTGPDWDDWRPGARIETDFYGNASGSTPELRMRLAYAQMEKDGWLIRAGQDWDALTVELPKTVNFATYNNQGALWSRRPLIKAQWQGDAGPGEFKIIGAVASAVSGDLDGSGQLDGKDSGVPNLEATVVYELPLGNEWSALVALGGAYGQSAFDLPLGGEDVYNSSVGMLTGALEWTGHAKLMGSIWAGENIACFGGAVGQSVNLVKGTAIGARGGWVQLQTFPFERLNWNLAFGLDDPLDGDLNPGMRNYNLDASTSLYYQLTSYLTLAAEYSYLETGYKNAPNAMAHRIQTSAFVEF
ncbi:MAG: hypothetical protein ACQKBV_00615 [Puniceicoccales bacterium]